MRDSTALLVMLACACGGSDDAPAGADGGATGGGGGVGATGGSSASGGAVGSGGSTPGPGPSKDGWKRDYVEGSAVTKCDKSEAEMKAAGLASLTVENTTLYAGYEQVGDNQNPIVARFDSGTLVWCERHETEGPDGRAVGVTWDGGDAAYVVYTIVGGGSSLENKGGWLPSYAPGSISGGGPKVSVVGRVNVQSGALEKATFIIAVKSDNKVNSHSPRGAVTVLPDGNVEFLGESAHKPIDVDKKAMDCTDYPFDSRYVLTPDLSDAVCAECSNCTAKEPCN